MLWIVGFFVIVYLLFKPSQEPYQNLEVKEDYLRAKSYHPPQTLKDYYNKPVMTCPDNYERTMDTLQKVPSTETYYGYTGSHHKYIDSRFLDESKMTEPLPVYADFFMY